MGRCNGRCVSSIRVSLRSSPRGPSRDMAGSRASRPSPWNKGGTPAHPRACNLESAYPVGGSRPRAADGRRTRESRKGRRASRVADRDAPLRQRGGDGWEPPDALEAAVAGEVTYIPLTYGYVSYSIRSHSRPTRRFFDIPGVAGSILGGAGIPISASTKRLQEATAFAAWVCSAQTQHSIVATSEANLLAQRAGMTPSSMPSVADL